MRKGLVAVLTPQRQTRRQVARALTSAGINTRFFEQAAQVRELLAFSPQLLILDCDNPSPTLLEETLAILEEAGNPCPVILLSMSSNKGPLMSLIQRHDISNLVAKHGAIRAVFPVLDERELLVTCEKVIKRDIFGLQKYVGLWGVVFHRAVITSIKDKGPLLTDFEQYLVSLDCQETIVQGIVSVAEELILNAVVHAPRNPDGSAKYEGVGPRADLVLDPSEYVHVTYGCDGQRLMVSVTDNFGRLSRQTLHGYVARGFEAVQLAPEDKASGAGLGLSLSVRSIHQLIFNIQDSVKTEVIAGWYLRVNSASEFRQVSKSLNVFWLPKDSVPVVDADPKDLAQRAASMPQRTESTRSEPTTSAQRQLG
jgi:hypothetical protein